MYTSINIQIRKSVCTLNRTVHTVNILSRSSGADPVCGSGHVGHDARHHQAGLCATDNQDGGALRGHRDATGSIARHRGISGGRHHRHG